MRAGRPPGSLGSLDEPTNGPDPQGMAETRPVGSQSRTQFGGTTFDGRHHAGTGRIPTLRRTVLFVDGTIFIVAALLNVGVKIPLGVATLRFADPIWQAGTGEALIGATLLAAGLRGHARLAWAALWASVLGIAIGLASDRVQGAARAVHVVLVPLAVILFVLLLWSGRRSTSTLVHPREDVA